MKVTMGKPVFRSYKELKEYTNNTENAEIRLLNKNNYFTLFWSAFAIPKVQELSIFLSIETKLQRGFMAWQMKWKLWGN